MRKIKYIAYAKEYNKIVQVDRLGLNSDGSVQEILFSYRELGEDSDEWTDLQAGQFSLEEFIGQYDVEGEEIYTGYIVSFTTNIYLRDYVGVVEWSDQASSYVIRAKDHYDEYFNEINSLKVIGNIYKNKELLDE